MLYENESYFLITFILISWEMNHYKRMRLVNDSQTHTSFGFVIMWNEFSMGNCLIQPFYSNFDFCNNVFENGGYIKGNAFIFSVA